LGGHGSASAAEPAERGSVEQNDITIQQANFVEALESGLQLHGIPFDRASLLSFVSLAWPLIEENPDVGFWVSEFLKAGNVAWV
jgi:hypothetical protein